MCDELEKLEFVIREILQSGVGATADSFANSRTLIQGEAERIKKAFIKKAFGLRKEKHIELYIQYHQSSIIHLIDTVLETLPVEEIPSIHHYTEAETLVNLLKWIYATLEELLNYIEKHFSKYFNQYAKTPESYRFIVHREIMASVPEIRYALEKKQVQKRLITAALSPLDSFISEVSKDEMTYRKLMYLRALTKALEDLANSSLTAARLDFKICLGLAYLNYNSHKFFKFCVREISRLVQEQGSLSKQIEKLAYMLKIINQIQVKPGFVYHEKSRSLKDQISDWISAELDFFEKRQQLSINFPIQADEPVQKQFKLKVDLTVSQFSYFLKMLKEVGVIKNHNVLEVIRFMAGIVQTKHTDNVSSESLRSKYYQADDGARDAVKDVVIEMLNYVRK